MALNDREHVVEIMRNTGGKLPDRLHLLRLAQLRFEFKPVGDIFNVALHHFAGDDREERPRQRARDTFSFHAQLAATGGKAIANNNCRVRRKNFFEAESAERLAHPRGSIVEISKLAVAGKFEDGVWIDLSERRQL